MFSRVRLYVSLWHMAVRCRASMRGNEAIPQQPYDSSEVPMSENVSW